MIASLRGAAGCAQLRFDLAASSPGPTSLAAYDVILVNSSGGKDSQAALDVVVDSADREGVRGRIVVVHCDLGRVEWAGTAELAAGQAAHYGLRFETVRRRQDLLDHVASRGMWPSAKARYCTSDHKTSQVLKLMTALVREHDGIGRPVRILNCLGIRAQESPARARKAPFGVDRATNTRRHVDRWLVIHDWTESQVWERIARSGVPHHPAYDAGMPRLSCCFCVLSSKAALIRAAQLNPALAGEYLAVEDQIGHRFRADLSMADIVAAGQR